MPCGRPDGSRAPRGRWAVARPVTAVRRWAGARVLAARRRDAGMTTAEYAVGTVAACGFGAVLVKVLSSDAVASALSGMVESALRSPF
ncbi:DUF4244 domain-containing protein [Streptomyces capparidis]